MRSSDAGLNGVFPSKACSTMPSSTSPKVRSWYSAKAFSTFKIRFSMRTPVCTRSTTSFCSSTIRTNVPRYIGMCNANSSPASTEHDEAACALSRARVVYNLVSPFSLILITIDLILIDLLTVGLSMIGLSAAMAAQFPAQRTLLALDDEIYGLRLEKMKKIEALGQATC